jgi:uncharacterized phage protein (TIGR02218 family)
VTTVKTSEGGLVAVAEVTPAAVASQGGLVALAEVLPSALATQGGLIGVAAVQPVNHITEGGLVVVGNASDCTTRRAQMWQIFRRDGVILRFTSHDADLSWGDQTYESCDSLNETASEQSSDQGDVGSIDLTGILSSGAISEEDIYAGLYDDAFVQVWRVPWDSDTDRTYRVAAGWFGTVKQAENGFTVEVLGPGARMLQKALLQTIAPTCRWEFGDPDTCMFDREALAIGGTVTVPGTRAFFYGAVVDPGGVAQWSRGKVRWLYGRNAGLEVEVREVDFATGLIILAISTAFTPEAGDDFLLLPGCDLSTDQCTKYDNLINHGGFPFVPGQDFVSQTPDAKA